MADADLVSVLDPFDYVCKQTDAAKREGKLRKIYDIKVVKKDGKKLLKRLVERTRQGDRTRQQGDQGEELRQLVQRYTARLRNEVPNKFGGVSCPLQEFQKMVDKDMSRPDPARFSLATTKGPRDDCFVALVNKDLKEGSGDIVGMTFYFLEDGVKRRDTGGAVQGGEEEGAVGGAAEEKQRHLATLVLPRDWRKSFVKSLEKNIHLCHGHLRPALEVLPTRCNSYIDRNGKICKFSSSSGDRQLVQGRKIFQSKLSYKLQGKNPHSKSYLCKVHLNGEGSDCYLVYVDQNYKQMGRVFLLVGVFTHSECGVRKGAKKKEHATQRGGDTKDITEDMEAAEEFLEQPNT